jgi:hypothetical protein
MSKRNLVIEEGSVEALARLQKQDDEFCRRLRAAIETGRECCPTTVFTEPCTNRPVSNYFPPSDGDCHTPLPCEVRKGKNTTP